MAEYRPNFTIRGENQTAWGQLSAGGSRDGKLIALGDSTGHVETWELR